MPIYKFKCSKCGKILKDVFQKMSDDNPECCGESMITVPSLCFVDCFPAEGITLTNVEAQPKTFYSKKEMRSYAKSRDLELGALL